VKRVLGGAFLFLSLFLVISSLAAQETNQSLADIARQERERKKDQAKKDQAKPLKVLTNDDLPGKGGGPESAHNPTAEEKSAAEAKSPPPEGDATKDKTPQSVTTPPPLANKADDGRKQITRLGLSVDERRALRILFIIAGAEENCYAAMGVYVPIEQMRNGCIGTGGSYRFTPRKEFDPQYDEEYQYSLEIIAAACHIHADPLRDGHAGFYSDGDEIYINPTGRASISDKSLRLDQVLDLLKEGSASK